MVGAKFDKNPAGGGGTSTPVLATLGKGSRSDEQRRKKLNNLEEVSKPSSVLGFGEEMRAPKGEIAGQEHSSYLYERGSSCTTAGEPERLSKPTGRGPWRLVQTQNPERAATAQRQTDLIPASRCSLGITRIGQWDDAMQSGLRRSGKAAERKETEDREKRKKGPDACVLRCGRACELSPDRRTVPHPPIAALCVHM